MQRSNHRRLAALEQAQDTPDVWSLPAVVIDEDGHTIGIIPPEPLPAVDAMGRRLFDYEATVAALVRATNDE